MSEDFQLISKLMNSFDLIGLKNHLKIVDNTIIEKIKINVENIDPLQNDNKNIFKWIHNRINFDNLNQNILCESDSYSTDVPLAYNYSKTENINVYPPPIYIAAQQKRDDVLKFLINCGSDINKIFGDEHHYIYDSSTDLESTVITPKKLTTLNILVKSNNIEMVEFFLEHGARLDIKNKDDYIGTFNKISSDEMLR